MAMNKDQQIVEAVKDFCQSEYNRLSHAESCIKTTDYAKGMKNAHSDVLDIIAKYE